MKRIALALSVATAVMLSGCKEGSQASTEKTTDSTATKTEKVETNAAGDKELVSEKEKFSFVIGYNTGTQLKALEDEVERDILIAAIIDGLDAKEPKLSPDEAVLVQKAVFGRLQEKEMAKQKEAAEKQKLRVEEGKKFLTHNKTQPGVVTTESGLQYTVVKDASGAKPALTDVVEVHYEGTLVDGTVFDSSIKRKTPSTFPVNAVIKGWQEGLQLMPVGSKYKFFIPTELAYGARPNPRSGIGPNEMLIFEVELLSIKPKEEKKEVKKVEDKPVVK